jgi:hypothetical protein
MKRAAAARTTGIGIRRGSAEGAFAGVLYATAPGAFLTS